MRSRIDGAVAQTVPVRLFADGDCRSDRCCSPGTTASFPCQCAVFVRERRHASCGATLSGKDPRRIDRVGAYAARYVAKNVAAAGLAKECEVQLSYSIGLARPVSVQVETFGTGVIADEQIAALLTRDCDFRLAGILKQFRLRFLPSTVKGGFYRKLAAYGHVGRMDIGLPWEVTDKAPLWRELYGHAMSVA